MSPFSTPASHPGGIQPWGNHQVEFNDAQAKTITMISRTDALLSQLPYMARISRSEVELKELNKIAGFGFTESQNTVQRRPRPSNDDNTTEPPSEDQEEKQKLVLSDDDIVDD